jgi:hypothetical protein
LDAAMDARWTSGPQTEHSEQRSSRQIDELSQALQAAGSSIAAARMALRHRRHVNADITEAVDDAGREMKRAYKAFHRLRELLG